MNSLRTVCAVTLLSGAILSAASANAQVQQLIINEISSTSLTATLNGVPQTVNPSPFSSDFWTILTAGVDGFVVWDEPNEPGKVNGVQGRSELQAILVDSDAAVPGSFLADGATDTTHFTINGQPLDVTFNDLASRSEQVGVPDTASTLPLLSLALGAIAVLSKRR